MAKDRSDRRTVDMKGLWNEKASKDDEGEVPAYVQERNTRFKTKRQKARDAWRNKTIDRRWMIT